MKQFLFFAFLLLAIPTTYAQTSGCTDPLSLTYNARATVNDGSCTYPKSTVKTQNSVNLPLAVAETSGLIDWNGSLLTHNDDTDSNLYAINNVNGEITDQFALPDVTNKDWEEISQDTDYIYVGDFGNNAHGNRSDLKIYRILKESLSSHSPIIDIIFFNYENQSTFISSPANTTEFDCEAFVVSTDNIYLFTKNWTTKTTSVYKIPKIPGNHSAQLMETWNVQGLITAATYQENKRLLVLTGYNATLHPFIYLLYDFNSDHFFSANKRKLNISLPFHQIESITTTDGISYHLTNERFSHIFNVPPQLHTINLSPYLSTYIAKNNLSTSDHVKRIDSIKAYYNNHLRSVIVESDKPQNYTYNIYDTTGTSILNGNISKSLFQINVSEVPNGIYYLEIGNCIYTIDLVIN